MKMSSKKSKTENETENIIDISDFTIAYSKYFDIPNSLLYKHEEKIKFLFENCPTLYSLIIQ